MNTKPKFVPALVALLAFTLSACGTKSKIKFAAPEIEPPADLIPAYLPEDFELVQGFKVPAGDSRDRRFFGHSCKDDQYTFMQRMVCCLELPDPFFGLKSPAGNDILGVSYQEGDHLLLITKSYFPGGSLDSWRATFEVGDDTKDRNCDCDCTCGCYSCDCFYSKLFVADSRHFPFRQGGIQEIRTIGGTQVAIVDRGLTGMNVVFVRGDNLLTIESNIPLEEVLKIVESLLK